MHRLRRGAVPNRNERNGLLKLSRRDLLGVDWIKLKCLLELRRRTISTCLRSIGVSVVWSRNVLVDDWVEYKRLRVLRPWQVRVSLRLACLFRLLDRPVPNVAWGVCVHGLRCGQIPCIVRVDDERMCELRRGAVPDIDRIVELRRLQRGDLFGHDGIKQQLVRCMRPRQVHGCDRSFSV